MRRLLFLACLLSTAPVLAQEATQFPVEPKVQRIVVEDDNARVEELRVRGQTQRIVVKPKIAGARPYEILPADGARDLSPGPSPARGAAGQRVWNVFEF
jgi:hypothetical protein